MSAFLESAIALAAANIDAGRGGPFGAVVVREGEIIGRGTNQVIAQNDPTAHAEIVAIREASAALRTPHLSGCLLYASSEPCPMCLAAAYWARLPRIDYALSRDQAAAMGFDDAVFYHELSLPPEARSLIMTRHELPAAAELVTRWNESPHRRLY